MPTRLKDEEFSLVLILAPCNGTCHITRYYPKVERKKTIKTPS